MARILPQHEFFFLKVFLWVFVCGHVYVSTRLLRPKEGTGLFGTGVVGVYKLFDMVGTEFQSFLRATSVLNH